MTFTHAIMHQKHLAQSEHSTWSAVDIFNSLGGFTKEPIREQEIELECMNHSHHSLIIITLLRLKLLHIAYMLYFYPFLVALAELKKCRQPMVQVFIGNVVLRSVF